MLQGPAPTHVPSLEGQWDGLQAERGALVTTRTAYTLHLQKPLLHVAGLGAQALIFSRFASICRYVFCVSWFEGKMFRLYFDWIIRLQF